MLFPRYGAEGLKMTVLQLIILGVAVGSFAIGRYSGYHDGYVKGRIAVRRYYESLERVSR
jgi:hypothetical protein